jgi:hypothetical protein
MFSHKFEILNNEQEPKWALPKILARCDEIMRRDEIRWFDDMEVTRS